jgi:hypothetical protein
MRVFSPKFIPTLRYIFSIALFFTVTSVAVAQTMDTTDTLEHKYLPTGLRLGTDAISMIQSFAGTKFDGWEVNADVDFYKYYLAVDYGSWARHLTLSNGNYENDGNYFRVGIDLNFLAKDPDRNMVFLGFRYGQSNFSEQLTHESVYATYGTLQHELTNGNMIGRWAELTTGLRVKVWKGFWMGYTARLKFLPRIQGAREFVPYEIPGYGLAAENPYWGFSYQLFWRIPFRKD